MEKQNGGSRKKPIVYVLVIILAAVIAAAILMPVFRIYGNAMEPALKEGSLAVTLKGTKLDRGDICAFYYNNKILVRRVIGCPGDLVDIEEDGGVILNGQKLDEPYVSVSFSGKYDIELPLQIPENQYFVMGDNRGKAIDSRNEKIGCVEEEQMIGKIVFCIWPASCFGVK